MGGRLFAASIAGLAAVLPASAQEVPTAHFDFVEYRALEPQLPTPAGMFRNPVLPGFHPDPSIVRVGDDFYLVNSTFSWFPGLPIFHSRDLVHWKLVGHAIDRPGMVDFSGLGTNRGLFAPAITHHDGKFWIVNTCIDCGGNFAITADRAEGPWSDPVWLPFDGIDPSLFFDDDGSAWIVYNDAPPGEPQYEGHRALWLQRFDPATMQMDPERTLLVDGGVVPEDRPIWAEGPHIYKVGEWYFLLTAEGGTADQHSQTIWRAPAVTGPYTPGRKNPILTQRNMDPARPDRVEATGHADVVRLDDGSWWGVFLATRPFAGQSTLMGRETFLLPLRWEDGWPHFLDPGEVLPPLVARPQLPQFSGTDWRHWRDDFADVRLSPEWISLRTPGVVQQLGLDRAAGELWIIPGRDSAHSPRNPAFTGRRLRHHAAEVTTRVAFAPREQGDFAGLLAYMDEAHFLAFGIEGSGSGPTLVARLKDSPADEATGAVIARVPLAAIDAIDLRLRIDGGSAHLAWRPHGADDWIRLVSDADIEGLASVHAGLFTGLVIGPYAAAGD